MSYNAKEIARYFFCLDKDETLFPKDKMITVNGLTMYEGNVRVNKFLHLSQNVHIAKYGQKLFFNDLFAYVNGGIVLDVQTNYQVLKHLDNSHIEDFELDVETEKFLKNMFCILRNAPIEELIEISHEDEEWIECSALPRGRQIMNPLSRAEEYHTQYADVVSLIDEDYFREEVANL